MQSVDKPANIAKSTALSFITGNAPGKPKSTTETLALGTSPNSLFDDENNFVFVFNWEWTYKPITASNFIRTPLKELLNILHTNQEYYLIIFPVLEYQRTKSRVEREMLCFKAISLKISSILI